MLLFCCPAGGEGSVTIFLHLAAFTQNAKGCIIYTVSVRRSALQITEKERNALWNKTITRRLPARSRA